MSKILVDTIDTRSGTTNLTIGSTNSSTVTFENGAVTGHNYPAFAAKMSAGQSISNDSSTKIQYNTEVFDTDSAYDNSTNYRFTVPSGKAGKYYIGASVRSGNITDGKKINLNLFINGSEVTEHFAQVVSSNGSEQYTIGIFKVLDLSASDYVEVYALHQSGSAVTFSSSSSIGSYFYGYRIGS